MVADISQVSMTPAHYCCYLVTAKTNKGKRGDIFKHNSNSAGFRKFH